MKFVFLLHLVLLGFLPSCSNVVKNDPSEMSISEFHYDSISVAIRDSLISYEDSGLIPLSLSVVTAIETENNMTLEWILNNGSVDDFKLLLHQHPRAELKAVGIKGLIKSNEPSIFKHLKFAFEQDINVQYGFYCQKLGGYFLYQLDYRKSDITNARLTKEEVESINNILEQKFFGCS